MRAALLSANAQARNAIGNNVAEKLAFFLDRGADVRVFLQTADRLHPALAEHVDLVSSVTNSGPVWDFLAGADLVIADYAQYHDLLHFLPLLAGKKPRLLLEYHGVTAPDLWPSPQRERLEKSRAERGLVWCADAALVHSRFMCRDLIQATGYPAGRIVQLDFPMDERFHPAPSDSFLRARLSLGDARILLFVGRLAVNKRVPLLIEAVARMRLEEPLVHAVIVGDQTDLYGVEAERCRELAKQLGVSGRVHFLGSVADDDLGRAYRDADVLVLPSVHEGFGIPALEALACGLPVVAARAAALPETVGVAGLTFVPDDADDLARQLKRVLIGTPPLTKRGQGGLAPRGDPPPPPPPSQGGEPVEAGPKNIAIVCFRFGADIVGGAETSLRKIARALRRAGHHVEIFTTCTRHESDWTNAMPAGTTREDGLMIHRFPIDPHDRGRHHASVRAILEAGGLVSPELEKAYLRHSIHSTRLIDTLRTRIDGFATVITGPYLFGLTHDIATAFSDKTLLVPCFHQEPLARLGAWPNLYGQVGGLLFHSLEEQELAQTELGINHPNATEMGTYVDVPSTPLPLEATGDAAKPYLVYCGRYSAQKDVPHLLEYAARYQELHPGRFDLVFLGQGEVQIPRQPWIRDLGRVDEQTKHTVLAGAAALVQLSRQESLSLVALEAWAQGTPVLVDSQCAVLAGQVRRSQGGRAVETFEDFAQALDDCWANPAAWMQMGQRGRAYVKERYGSEQAFAGRLLQAIQNLHVPLREQMRQRGLERAQRSSRAAWRERFGQIVEQLLDVAPHAYRDELAVLPYRPRIEVKTGTRSLLLPVRVQNRGTHAALAEGLARAVVWAALQNRLHTPCAADFALSGREELHGPPAVTPLPRTLLPQQTQSLAVAVPLPAAPGDYRLRLWSGREDRMSWQTMEPVEIELQVGKTGTTGCAAPFLEVVREALAEADRLKRLPKDYLDITEGCFARWKRWLKLKLLGNFKRGYVDVLSRQQSQVNEQLLQTVQQLAECCATLDHAVRGLQDRLDRLESEGPLMDEQVDTARFIASLS